jgi:hypothetical protein
MSVRVFVTCSPVISKPRIDRFRIPFPFSPCAPFPSAFQEAHPTSGRASTRSASLCASTTASRSPARPPPAPGSPHPSPIAPANPPPNSSPRPPAPSSAGHGSGRLGSISISPAMSPSRGDWVHRSPSDSAPSRHSTNPPAESLRAWICSRSCRIWKDTRTTPHPPPSGASAPPP